ncbi:MAG: aminotransferase class V-fold PLP-dependent enzyme [Deinococcales bacterium]
MQQDQTRQRTSADFTTLVRQYQTKVCDFAQLRQQEYGRLDTLGHVYLDYTGGGLYALSQLEAHHHLLKTQVFGNPHSINPTSLAMTQEVEATRQKVLSYFSADPQDYEVIFTLNASGALKLVGEAYPFGKDSCYLLSFDNHNSVLGIREFARRTGARLAYVPLTLPDLRLDESALAKLLEPSCSGNKLFAYPAQSNFSGVQHPLEWVNKAKAAGWDVLLDAAAFVPTNRLDLSQYPADFISISFYKIFGYPTGVGCLLARKEALAKLKRPWFAGGTISLASVQGDKHYLHQGAEAFEDGTVNYLNLPAIAIGLEHIEKVGIEQIHQHIHNLAQHLLSEIQELKHSNDLPLIKLYGPYCMEQRGGTLTMNFYDAEHQLIPHQEVEAKAAKANISLRTGCFCNPGSGESAFGISQGELQTCFAQKPDSRLTLDDLRLCIDGKNSGAVRVSLGIASNLDDIKHFLSFCKNFLN